VEKAAVRIHRTRRIPAEKVVAKTQLIRKTLPTQKTTAVKAEMMKRLPEMKRLRRKEAKWLISFRMARYPSIRTSSFP
jgi:hypothetical protein